MRFDPSPPVKRTRSFAAGSNRKIRLISPKVIVTLGNFATKLLLGTKEGITKLRGKAYPYRSGVLVPTFHPAFLLRSPERKKDVWEDMKLVRDFLAVP